MTDSGNAAQTRKPWAVGALATLASAITLSAGAMAAVPVEVEGNDVFGIHGLTPGGLGIWGLIGLIIIWWIRGMADRRRAANEGTSANAAATAVLIKHLTEEVERLGKLVASQSGRITELEHKLLQTEGEVVRLKAANAGLGDAAQHAALIVAAERLDRS